EPQRVTERTVTHRVLSGRSGIWPRETPQSEPKQGLCIDHVLRPTFFNLGQPIVFAGDNNNPLPRNLDIR
ncbi:MAG: hypothetical protein ACJASJ_001546, partial [Candidatus Azotimanducaceae bacterium]